MFFSNSNIAQTNSQKHFGVVLDSKSMFHDLDIVFTKVRKAIGVLRKLNIVLLRIALVTIFKTFVQPHLDYSDVLYDQTFNGTFQNKLEWIQCNACLAVTGVVTGPSREKLYHELGLESPQLRRWCRKLCLFYNISKNQFLNIHRHSLYNTRNISNLKPFLTQSTAFLKTRFFHRLSSNEINEILSFAIRRICLFLRNKSCSSYDHPRILCITLIIRKA